MAKRIGAVKLPLDLLERLDEFLGEGETRADLIVQAISMYLSGVCVPLDEQQVRHWFVNSKKLDLIKQHFEIESDKIEMTEAALVNHAVAISGISLQQILIDGRQYRAQDLITRSLSTVNREGHTQGIAGAANDRLDRAYEEVKEMVKNGEYKPKDGRISLTAIASKAMANYNTAKSWAERRSYSELLSSTPIESVEPEEEESN